MKADSMRTEIAPSGKHVLRVCLFWGWVLCAACGPNRADDTTPQSAATRQQSEFTPEWDVAVIRVGSFRVLHKQTPGKAVVALRMYFLGGSQNLTAKTSGIEQLVLSTAELGGSQKYPLDRLSDALSARGIQLQVAAGQDYSVLAARCVRPHFEKTWDILVDLTLRPRLEGQALEIQRGRQLKAIATRFDRPDSQVSLAAERFYFDGHPYARLQLGTRENVAGFSAADLQRYHQNTLLRADRMVLVVVGDLDRKKLAARARKAFGALKAGAKPFSRVAPPVHTKPAVKTISRAIPATFVLGYFKAPPPGHPDYPAARIASAFLSEELFTQIRTKRRLAYAVSAGISVRRANVGYIYISTRKPNRTVAVALTRIRKLIRQGISQQDLAEMQSVFVTRRLMKLQTQSAQARLIARARLTAGDHRWAEKYLEQMRRVTPADVKRVLETYLRNIQFVALGPHEIDPKRFTKPVSARRLR
jgi:zinc protease